MPGKRSEQRRTAASDKHEKSFGARLSNLSTSAAIPTCTLAVKDAIPISTLAAKDAISTSTLAAKDAIPTSTLATICVDNLHESENVNKKDRTPSVTVRTRRTKTPGTGGSITNMKREQIVPLLKEITTFLENKFHGNKTQSVVESVSHSARPSVTQREHSSNGINSPIPSTSQACYIRPMSPEISEKILKSRDRVRTNPKGINDEIELQPNSRVFVDAIEVEFIKTWKWKPSEMVRRLMLYLVGAEQLKTMTALGTRARKRVPRKILKAVKYFVDDTVGSTMDNSTYIQIINQQCGTLRKPKRTNKILR